MSMDVLVPPGTRGANHWNRVFVPGKQLAPIQPRKPLLLLPLQEVTAMSMDVLVPPGTHGVKHWPVAFVPGRPTAPLHRQWSEAQTSMDAVLPPVLHGALKNLPAFSLGWKTVPSQARQHTMDRLKSCVKVTCGAM